MKMFLLNPLYLVCLIFIPIVIILKNRKNAGVSVLFSNFCSYRERSSVKYRVPAVLDTAAVFLAIVALARPVSLEKEISPPVEGKDIIIALDVSGSMEALDFQPDNRIEAAKTVIKDFVKTRKSDRLGLVFFARDSFLQVPLTTDYDIFNELLARLKTGVVEDGTAIGNGIGLALSRLQQSKAKSRLIILLTDGDNNAGNISPVTAAEIAAKEGVKIYSILIGTDEPVPFPTGKDMFGRDTFRKVHIKTDPELLKKISSMSEGRFYQSISTEELQKAFFDIDQLEKSPVPARSIKIYKEYAPRFILFAMLLICLARMVALLFRVYPEVER
jgi:Ca-activated chloride channel homolog